MRNTLYFAVPLPHPPVVSHDHPWGGRPASPIFWPATDRKERCTHASLRDRIYRAPRSERAGARDDRALSHDGDRPGRPDSPPGGLGPAPADLSNPKGPQGTL